MATDEIGCYLQLQVVSGAHLTTVIDQAIATAQRVGLWVRFEVCGLVVMVNKTARTNDVLRLIIDAHRDMPAN